MLCCKLRKNALAAVIVVAVTTGCASTNYAAAGDLESCPGTDDVTDIEGCQFIDGDLIIEHVDGAALQSLADLRRVGGSLQIRHNPALQDLDALQELRRVDGDVHLVTLPEVSDVDGLHALQHIGGELHVVDVDIPFCRAADLAADLESSTTHFVGLSGPTECDGNRRPTGDEADERSPDVDGPIDELPELDEMRRGDLLEGVHPEFVDRLRLMYALLEHEGIEITFVSGYRPHETFYDAENRHASWHNLGMAVDLNLTHRDSLEEAQRHYDGEDADDWERIGEIANGLGIIWGEWFDDIFHFEWHPDYHARIRDHEMQQFQRLAGSDLDDYTEVWSLFGDGDQEDDADDCSGGCHVIPDDGLRQLLEQLRR